MIRRNRSGIIAVSIIFLLPVASPSPALSNSKTYDMSRFLSEPYPFAVSRNVEKHSNSTQSSQRRQKSLSSSETFKPTIGQYKPSSVAKNHRPKVFADGWLSEIRAGALKHAVSLVGNTAKETGIDGNIELLFQTPSWLKFLWSPRPMTGVSANSSSTNTDLAYTGLTWEWNPWADLILDFSFGFAIHNGKLKYDATEVFPEDAGRHREFGCRWLFRETLEAGWLFANRHLASLMWSHYSHGGLCDDKNEGLDNIGIRYGYRF